VEDLKVKKLVLAEKPSVGRQLAQALGCNRRMDGYMEGDAYIVTWALGHLVELANPDVYTERWRRWSLKDLPMLPSTLIQVPIEQTSGQLEVVKTLMARSDVSTLVIATDAGREGELVARWIMKLAGWQGATERLWISSQTSGAIAEGFANLKEGSLYDNLYEAAESRAAADWYVGMNVTRAMTCAYDARLSAGRVQTPTLALMTSREDEIESFAGAFYWTLRADFTHFWASYYPEPTSVRITDEALATRLETSLPAREGRVVSVERADRAEEPPLAYDLTELQRDANLLLDLSAKETLDTLQGLYERHRIVTYPRTDSRYITADIVPTLKSRLAALSRTPFAPLSQRYIEEGFRIDEERFVQDAKVGDHHAIIPTEEMVDLSRLSAVERSLFELIALRFLEVLSGDYRYQTTTVTIDVDGYPFKARLTVPVEQGWRSVAALIGKRSAQADATADEESASPHLLTLSEGDRLMVAQTRLRRLATSPPPRYSEATLLSAMEHAGRLVDDLSIKRQMSGGIGTPATRADIIEKLIQNHYIERVGKELVPTPRGRELVRLVPEELRSVRLTGEWEQRLSNIALGTEESAHFIADIKENTKALVSQVISSGEVFNPKFIDSKRCPHCEGPMMKVIDPLGQNHYICQRLSCAYEEREIKKRVFDEAAPVVAKKRVVVKKAEEGEGKKRVVLVKKRDEAETRPYHWETVIEVVRPSKRQRRDERAREERGGWKSAHGSPHLVEKTPSGGGSIADFMKAREERDRRDRKKGKK
jgi:DNA topoisomerase-3